MAKPERRDPAKEKFWRRMMQCWQRSGWTARDFCFEHDLQESSFYAWRREIARRDREATAVESTLPVPPSASLGPATPVFMRLAIEDGVDDVAGPPGIELVIGPRRRLFVRPGFDADLLRQLLRVLEEAPC